MKVVHPYNAKEPANLKELISLLKGFELSGGLSNITEIEQQNTWTWKKTEQGQLDQQE